MRKHFLRISWSVSRGQDTYGYNICRLDDTESGARYRTCGGGYDMIGTVFGEWLEDAYQDDLAQLAKGLELELYGNGSAQYTKEYSGFFINKNGSVSLDGGCGISSMQRIARAIGLKYEWLGNRKGNTTGYIITQEESVCA